MPSEFHTPTEALIAAMELADDMRNVIILYQTHDEPGRAAIGWITTIKGLTELLGVLEEAKIGAFSAASGAEEDDDISGTCTN